MVWTSRYGGHKVIIVPEESNKSKIQAKNTELRRVCHFKVSNEAAGKVAIKETT